MSKDKQPRGCLGIFLWPLLSLWWLLRKFVKLMVRLAFLFMGMMLMVVGALLTMTIIGAVFGIPLAILGLVFVVRSLF